MFYLTIFVYVLMFIAVVFHIHSLCSKEIRKFEEEIENSVTLLKSTLKNKELLNEDDDDLTILRVLSKIDYESLFRSIRGQTLLNILIISSIGTPIIILSSFASRERFEDSLTSVFVSGIKKKFIMYVVMKVRNKLQDDRFDKFLKGVFSGIH